jgi:hypothetical protein
MTIIALWLVLSIAVGIWADTRGRNGVGWFFLAALISPLLGAIFLAVTRNLRTGVASAEPTAATHTRCPKCAEFVLPQATVCKHCGGALVPDQAYLARAAQEGEREKVVEARNSLLTVAGLIAAVVAVMFACSASL